MHDGRLLVGSDTHMILGGESVGVPNAEHEIGQDTVTAMPQIAAEELSLSIGQRRLDIVRHGPLSMNRQPGAALVPTTADDDVEDVHAIVIEEQDARLHPPGIRARARWAGLG